MQPQQPKGPNPNYDFIMNSGNKQKRGLLSGLGLPRPILLGLAGAVLLIVIILVVAVALGSKKGSSASVTDIMGRAQEISRVSSVAAQDSQDPNLDALAATVQAVLGSQQSQLSAYLSRTGQKADPKVLASFQNPATDSAFQTAVQNNNLPVTFDNYLVSSLNSYLTSLNDEYKKTSSTQLKSILADDYTSIQTILDSSSLKQS